MFTGSLALFGGDMIDGITESKSDMNLLGFGLIFAFLLLIYRKQRPLLRLSRSL
ncbi:hypothetical protein [Methanogenium cariaci]|uniref:hypothetical protein n=1 Tax=Methanogenium cariaci TaxID=2197 RepID=UPI001FDF5867|nr:hypothetical protein [Methanogenium cariaci]